MSERISGPSPSQPRISASIPKKGSKLDKTIKELIEPKLGKTLEIPPLIRTISKKATMPSKEKTRLEAQKIFSRAASRRGLSEGQIASIQKIVKEKYPIWRQWNTEFSIEGGQGKSGYTVRFDPQTNSVVTYFDKGDPLGKGAFGEVREAFFMLSEVFQESTEIVCKAPKNLTDKRIREDHLKEVEITRRLRGCKNVVQYVHVNKTGLLIERMAGTLESLLKEKELTPMGKLRVSRDLVHGMTEIHDKGLVHRDLHKGNVLFSKEGTFKVGDFGLTQGIGTERGTINTWIASPEEMNSQLFGPKNGSTTASDVWSMGLLLYEIEHGEPPFFATAAGTAPIYRSATKRANVLKRIRKLPKHVQSTILLWNGKGELKTRKEYRKLAHEYFSAKLEVREAHKNYLDGQKKFIQELNERTAPPKTKLENLIIKMLVLAPQDRIKSQDAWEEISELHIDMESEITTTVVATPSPRSPASADDTPDSVSTAFDDTASPYSPGSDISTPTPDSVASAIDDTASPYTLAYPVEDISTPYPPPFVGNIATPDSLASDVGDISTPYPSDSDVDTPTPYPLISDSPPAVEQFDTTSKHAAGMSPEVTMGASPEKPKPGEQQLLEAIRLGDVRKIRSFAAQGYDITGWQDIKGNTLLHYASIDSSQNRALTYLLELGANANSKNVSGDTPLHLAARQGNKKGFEILVKFGGDLNIENNEGLTPQTIE